MTQFVQCLTQSALTFLHVEEHVQLLGVEALVSDVAENVKLCVRQYWLWQTHHLAIACIRCEYVCSHGTDILCQTHHEFLANRVDGRVSNLCELLTEIVEEYLRTVTDDSERSVITHGSHRLLSVCRHRHYGAVDVLLSETEAYKFALIVRYGVLDMSSALQFLKLYAVG